MVYVNDTLYQIVDSQPNFADEKSSFNLLGKIENTVSSSEEPKENFQANALLLDRIHKTAFRRFGRQRRQQQTGGCYVGRWKFHCVDRAFSVPPFRF